MENWLYNRLPRYLEKNKVSVESDEVVEKLAFHIYNMVYNLCALVATHVAIHDPTNMVLQPRHLQEALAYVTHICYPEVATKKQSGGNENLEGLQSLDVIQGGSSEFIQAAYIVISASETKDMFPEDDLLELFSEFHVEATRHSLNIFKKILKMHMNCLMMDLHHKSPITYKKLDKILSLKRHAVFH